MNSVNVRDRVWLYLCTLSLLGYLACSESIRAFWREMSRLIARL
jgi:hypothetical protein